MEAFLNDEENFGEGETDLRIYLRSLFLDSSSAKFQWLSLIFKDQDVVGMARLLSLLYVPLDGGNAAKLPNFVNIYTYISFHFRKHYILRIKQTVFWSTLTPSRCSAEYLPSLSLFPGGLITATHLTK